MSSFTLFSSVRLPTKNNPYYVLTDDLVYERYEKWSGLYVVAPKWTKTDFTSLPWVVTLIWDRDDPRWIKASILHDFLFWEAKTLADYQLANEVFYEAMRVEGTPRWIATCFFLAVTLSKYPYFLYKNFISRKKSV
jgi:hypothetical protein